MLITFEIKDIYKERIIAAFRDSNFNPPVELTAIELVEFMLSHMIVQQVRQGETRKAKEEVTVPDDLITITDIQPSPE